MFENSLLDWINRNNCLSFHYKIYIRNFYKSLVKRSFIDVIEMIFIAIIWQKYIYLLKLIFYLTKAIMTECITLFPCLINHKNWFIAYLPILSLFRIFLETNFNIWNWKATAYFTFDTNVAIQNAEEKDEVRYTDVIIQQKFAK